MLKADIGTIAQYVKQLYDWYVPPFKPKTVNIGWQGMYKVLSKLPNFSPAKVLRTDGNYYATDYETFKKIIAWDWTNTRQYIVDTFDCDKFALYFKVRMAINFGINAVPAVFDYDGGHAYNVVVFTDKDEPYLYEPQNDRLFLPTKENLKKPYVLGQHYILIV